MHFKKKKLNMLVLINLMCFYQVYGFEIYVICTYCRYKVIVINHKTTYSSLSYQKWKFLQKKKSKSLFTDCFFFKEKLIKCLFLDAYKSWGKIPKAGKLVLHELNERQ